MYSCTIGNRLLGSIHSMEQSLHIMAMQNTEVLEKILKM